jgi:hypothetical protein
MDWVLSMAVVEGLSAEEVAGRLEGELGEETTGSDSGEEAGVGPGLPAVGVHGDGRAVILDEPYDDAPVLEDARLLARLSRVTRVVLFRLSERVNCGFFQVGCWVRSGSIWDWPRRGAPPPTGALLPSNDDADRRACVLGAGSPGSSVTVTTPRAVRQLTSPMWVEA